MRKCTVCLAVLLAMYFIGPLGTPFAMLDGSVSQGNISVFKNGKLNKKLSGLSPLEEGPLLVCDGKCMIKSNGISILAEDQAELAITGSSGLFNLLVRRGHVEFIISDSSQKIVFHTPQGVYSIAEVMFNASTDPVVRGYMIVDDSGSTVGVREGRMVFATAEGAKTVKADEQIILAMADVEKKEEEKKKKKAAYYITNGGGSGAAATGGAAGGEASLGFSSGKVLATCAVITAAATGLALSSNDSGGSSPVASPSQ